jgi:hypothetical protein
MAKKENICPLLKKECIGSQCAWHTKIRGTDNNTGQEVDHETCAIASLPMLLIENSNQQRGTGAAVESFRNEMVKANETTTAVLLASTNNLRLK